MPSGIPFYNFCQTQLNFNPGTIAANTSSEFAVTLPGLALGDQVVSVIKPTLSAGLDIGQARVSAANTARILFQNSTAAGITPGAETYLFLIYRPELPAGTADGLTNGAVIFK